MNDEKTENKTETPKKKQGFAVLDKAKLKELARKGGKAAHALGKGHKFTKEEAKAAGRKGAIASHASRARRQREQQQTGN